MRKLLLVLAALALVSSVAAAATMKPLSQQQKKVLVSYLKHHRRSPEDYVVSKFADHDIVFLGEAHRIKHDVLLVQSLIPRLYRAGVYNLGIEFANEEDQAAIDALITGDAYDEAAARRVQFHQYVAWGYVEYEDLYRRAWELNHSLPKGARRFRIVALNYRIRWDLLTADPTPEVRKEVFFKGTFDANMARIIQKEFLEKGEKALIYCGMHHAFTRYRQPAYDFEQKKFYGLNDNRGGNLLYEKYPRRLFLIALHAPWPSREDSGYALYPAGGAIDQVMRDFPGQRVGFDLVGSPFGELRDQDTYYSVGHPDFKLSDYADGYIYQKPFRDYEGVTVDPSFITPGNLQEAIAFLPNVESRRRQWTVGSFLDLVIRRDADIQARLRNLR